MASATAAVAGSTNMIGGGAAPTKAGSSGVESLPKEMNEMKLRDDKADHGDDKVRLSSCGSVCVGGHAAQACTVGACEHVCSRNIGRCGVGH